MIWLGYLLVAVYAALVIFLVGWIIKRFFGVEFSRKAIHILMFGAFPIYHFLIGPGYHLIILCGVLTAYSIASYFFGLGKTMEREERGTPGTVYYALSLLALSILVFVFPAYYPFFGLAFLALAFGDGFAGLFGLILKGPKIYKEKTVWGSLFCLGATFGFGVLYYLLLFGEIPVLALLAIALIATIVELVDYGLDNVFMPLVVFGCAIILIPYDFLALISCFVFAGLFLLIYLPKLMTYYGALFSALIGALVLYCGSYPCLLLFMGMYLLYFVIHLIKKAKKVKEDDIVEKGHQKDGWQVLANGTYCIVSAVLFLTTKQSAFVALMMCCAIGLFVDTMASDLGALSPETPYDVFRNQPSSKGLSGGMTLLGTFSSTAFAFLAAAILTWILGLPYYALFLIGGVGVIGCFIDSLLGSTLQAKYYCHVCDIITERPRHCDMQTELLHGHPWMTNDLVNFLSGTAVFGLGLLLLL